MGPRRTVCAEDDGRLTVLSMDLLSAANLLGHGGLVAFPTETVYGLGANAFNAASVARIFAVKQRPSFDPLIVHLASASAVSAVADASDSVVQSLIYAFWPGPLTLVLPKTDAVPGIVTSGLDTVAVRVPSHPVAHQLLVLAGVPVAAPSANTFGQLSPTRAEHVAADLGDRVDMIVDGGPTTWGVESTIVQVVDGEVRVLRLGAITLEQLEAWNPVVPEKAAVNAPGMLEQHYSPNTRMRMVDKIDSRDEDAVYISLETLSPSGDLVEAAANMFEALHEADEKGAPQIIVEWMPEEGLGRAMNDRLRRAAAKFS